MYPRQPRGWVIQAFTMVLGLDVMVAASAVTVVLTALVLVVVLTESVSLTVTAFVICSALVVLTFLTAKTAFMVLTAILETDIVDAAEEWAMSLGTAAALAARRNIGGMGMETEELR